MSWIKALPIIGELILKALEAWQRRDRTRQSKQQEQKYEDIKSNPSDQHAALFGDATGRVRVDRYSAPDHTDKRD